MNILACDLSINSPGFTVLTSTGDQFFYNLQQTDKWQFQNSNWDIRTLPKGWASANQYLRIGFIRDFVNETIVRHNIGLVAFEGYSFGASSASVTCLAELGGVVRSSVFDKGLQMLLVPPSTIKKFATGKGNAKKPQMVDAFLKRIQVPEQCIKSPSLNDIADSFFLAEIARLG